MQDPRTGLPKGGIACEAGRIIGVDFLFSNSYHTDVPDQQFPTRVLGLSALKYLDVGSNSIGGSIPPAIGELTDLVYLDFEDNKLTGTIPGDALGKLTKLTALSVGQNSLLTGDFPSAALLKLTSLTALAFDGDFVAGALPALDFAQFTEYCALYSIPFTCPLPAGSELCVNNGQSSPPGCTVPPTPLPTTTTAPAHHRCAWCHDHRAGHHRCAWCLDHRAGHHRCSWCHDHRAGHHRCAWCLDHRAGHHRCSWCLDHRAGHHRCAWADPDDADSVARRI